MQPLENLSRPLGRPTPAEVRQARETAGLTQLQAMQLVADAEGTSYRTWQNYEAIESKSGHRPIPRAVWELFLLKTSQHPTYALAAKVKQ